MGIGAVGNKIKEAASGAWEYIDHAGRIAYKKGLEPLMTENANQVGVTPKAPGSPKRTVRSSMLVGADGHPLEYEVDSTNVRPEEESKKTQTYRPKDFKDKGTEEKTDPETQTTDRDATGSEEINQFIEVLNNTDDHEKKLNLAKANLYSSINETTPENQAKVSEFYNEANKAYERKEIPKDMVDTNCAVDILHSYKAGEIKDPKVAKGAEIFLQVQHNKMGEDKCDALGELREHFAGAMSYQKEEIAGALQSVAFEKQMNPNINENLEAAKALYKVADNSGMSKLKQTCGKYIKASTIEREIDDIYTDITGKTRPKVKSSNSICDMLKDNRIFTPNYSQMNPSMMNPNMMYPGMMNPGMMNSFVPMQQDKWYKNPCFWMMMMPMLSNLITMPLSMYMMNSWMRPSGCW